MSPARDTKRPSRLSIRRLATLGALAFGLITLAVSFALISVSTYLSRTVDQVVRDTRSQAIASQLELDLLTYQRHSNLFVLTGEETADTARKELASRIRESLAVPKDRAGSAQEHALRDQAARHFDAYFQKREAAEARGLRLSDIVTASRSELSAAIHSLESIRDLKRSQVERAHAAARKIDEAADVAGWIAVGSLVLGFLVFAFAIRRYLLRPIIALHKAMKRFRTGDVNARGSHGGLREIAQLTQGFNQMAETLARQREDQLAFLAGVAHDLRNPLHGLKLGLHAIELEQSTASRARVRERLDRLVGRLARMVDDLLDATRIEAGTLELRPELFDVRDTVDDMVRLYAPTSPDHQIVGDRAPEPIVIHGDPLRIEQVVSNLLSNAIKFSPGGGLITVGVSVEGADAVLTVADRGVGISQDELPDIFLPFRRPKQNAIPGSGLGLSVVRRIVTGHRGRIDVESEPGVGTTVRIRLPLQPAAEQERQLQSAPADTRAERAAASQPPN